MIKKELIIHYEPKRISIIAETEKEVNERVALEVRKTKRAIESVELRDIDDGWGVEEDKRMFRWEEG